MEALRLPRLRVVVPAALVLVVALVLAGAPYVGFFLVVADPLQRSDAIFVLDGSTPSRELGAAALYHARLAPLVVLARAYDPLPEGVRRLAGEPGVQERSARILLHAGVPPTAIVRQHREVENTAEELAEDFAYARAHGFRRVILVTSPEHTRRVRLIWGLRYERALPAQVTPTPYERYDPARWWRSRHSIELTAHEVFGIVSFLVGSPLRTHDRSA